MKGMQSSKQGIWKGHLCQYKVYERGTFFVKNGISVGKRLDLRGEPPCIEICWVPPESRWHVLHVRSRLYHRLKCTFHRGHVCLRLLADQLIIFLIFMNFGFKGNYFDCNCSKIFLVNAMLVVSQVNLQLSYFQYAVRIIKFERVVNSIGLGRSSRTRDKEHVTNRR